MAKPKYACPNCGYPLTVERSFVHSFPVNPNTGRVGKRAVEITEEVSGAIVIACTECDYREEHEREFDNVRDVLGKEA